MSESLDPALWAKIAEDPLREGAVMRRVLPHLPHDVFIGEIRPSRNRVLELSVLGVATNMPKRWRQSKGLETTVDTTIAGRTKVRLRSTTRMGDPLFSELVADVVSTLALFPGADAATRVVERVLAWQDFYARRGEPFSEELAAGLFGELTLLGGFFVDALGTSAAAYGWTGPDPALQDFQFADFALEVKTYRGGGAGHMRISSERQLEHVGLTELYLAYVRLDQRQGGIGVTLLELINDVRQQFSASLVAMRLFEEKLQGYGWHDSYAEFRTECYEVRSVEFFLVSDTFPRLVSSLIPSGVTNVTYLVERSALDPYLIEREAVLAHLRRNNEC